MRCLLVALLLVSPSFDLGQQPSAASTEPAVASPVFHIRYVNGREVYIDAGRNAGLAEGTKLVIKQNPAAADGEKKEPSIEPGTVARLTVVSVASTSAVCEVQATARELVEGDSVSLPDDEVEKLVEKHALGNTRSYPMVVSFSEGDPLDEEVRESVPRPPLPEINEARGRIGFDTSVIRGIGQNGSMATEYGMVVRADITRIYGSHWNLNGYWRGLVQSATPASQATLQDLMNRTYQMSLTYVNPQAKWTAGIGRMYLPWASSLEVIDGGYFAHNLTSNTIAGVFGGSTPDPTAWNYDPSRRLAGAFLNAHGGSFEQFRYSSTVGFGVDMIHWDINRPFVFTENDFSFKRIFSLYHSMQIDKPTPNAPTPAINLGLGQSLLTLRAQVHPRVEIDLTHTYFRDVPTFESSLVGTGLLDRYLFQGISGGARIQFPERISGYFSLGRSSDSTDAKNSLNGLFGATMSNIWKTGIQADVHYSKFSSAFATGDYRSATVSRELSDRFQVNLQVGRQSFTSPLSTDKGSWIGNLFLDTDLGPRYFFQTQFTTQRGGAEQYNQWTATFGLRFDNRSHERSAAHAGQP